ncbi:DUF2283 domain-containing protein [Candidatus Magnetomonas plexicatena]|uniref:DUF2283 domain-containing protein n=1 Tax=Candidatus Magnetomonas plexicatena TaxID=2552947 RepID=UPI001C781D67|nr:DUF2283 domain-containing protein [Nitrospirales bacterium LBB_01]
MYVSYDDRGDVLYLRLDDVTQDVVNTRVSEDIVFDIGYGDKIVGIEIMNASKNIKLDNLLPVKYELSAR